MSHPFLPLGFLGLPVILMLLQSAPLRPLSLLPRSCPPGLESTGSGPWRSATLPRPIGPRRPMLRQHDSRGQAPPLQAPGLLQVKLLEHSRLRRVPLPLLPLQWMDLASCTRTCRLLPRRPEPPIWVGRLQLARPVVKRSLRRSTWVMVALQLSKSPPPLLSRVWFLRLHNRLSSKPSLAILHRRASLRQAVLWWHGELLLSLPYLWPRSFDLSIWVPRWIRPPSLPPLQPDHWIRS